MDEEELRPPPPPKPKFDQMSIEELKHLIAALEGEIGEAKAMIAAKQAAKGDADSVFKV